MARETLKGYVDLANATQTGSLRDALASFTSGAVGAGLAGAPRGALAAGGARLGFLRSIGRDGTRAPNGLQR